MSKFGHTQSELTNSFSILQFYNINYTDSFKIPLIPLTY